MKRNTLEIGALCCAAMLFGSSQTHGGLIYNLSFDQSQYFVDPGGTVTVNLILSEVATSPDTNRITNSFGVTAANVKISWSGGSFVNATTDAVRGAGFTQGSRTLNANDIVMGQFNLSDGVVGTQVTGPPGIREVGIGSVTFTAAALAGSVTTITLDQAGSGDDFTIKTGSDTTNFVVIDSSIMSGTATITTTPEPSSSVLIIIGGTALLALAWLRRSNRQVPRRT